jgi:hypothetical protein
MSMPCDKHTGIDIFRMVLHGGNLSLGARTLWFGQLPISEMNLMRTNLTFSSAVRPSSSS